KKLISNKFPLKFEMRSTNEKNKSGFYNGDNHLSTNNYITSQCLFAISSSMRAMLLLILVIASLAFFPQKDMFIAINLFFYKKKITQQFLFTRL
ncbi:hypothetical protein Lpp124_02443, partial [Lacticaseibacillus paracasei subsp. paracasei CNCM I-4649]